jgi:hypothetical protein
MSPPKDPGLWLSIEFHTGATLRALWPRLDLIDFPDPFMVIAADGKTRLIKRDECARVTVLQVIGAMRGTGNGRRSR